VTSPDVTVRTAKAVSSGPTVKTVTPSSAPQNITLDVSVSGSGFEPGSNAKWLLNGVEDPRVKTNSTTVISSTSLTANITIAGDAVPSLYDVAVITPLGKKGIGTEKFTVVAMEQLSAPAGSSGAHDVNSLGVIAGSIPGGCDSYNLPAIWRNEVPAVLPLPQGLCRGRALRITENGIILGHAYAAGATSLTESVPLIWKPEGSGYSVADLGTTQYGRPYDIQSANELGHAVVTIGISAGKAFWWSESIGFVLLKKPAGSTGCYLNDLSDTDEIIGSCNFEFQTTPTRYMTTVYWPSPTGDPVVLPRLTGYNYAHLPTSINNNGVVVGQAWNSAKSGLTKVGVRWIRNGSSWSIDVIPGPGGEVRPADIDDAGWITGVFFVTGGRQHGFVYQPGVAFRDLGAIGNESWAEAIATTSAGKHLIVGASATSNDDRAVLWHPDS
jgi:hypothetical protein